MVPPHGLIHHVPPEHADGYTAEITVRRGGPSVVFGVVSSPTAAGAPGFRPHVFTGPDLPALTFNRRDQQLSCRSPVPPGATYQLTWPRNTPLFNRPATDRHPSVNPPCVAAWSRSRPADRPNPIAPQALVYPGTEPEPVTVHNYARSWKPHAQEVREAALGAIRAAGFRRKPDALTHRGAHDARLTAVLARRHGRRVSVARQPPADTAFYQQAQALLGRAGLQRRESQTPRAFATQVSAQHPPLGGPLSAFTEAYYALYFGVQPLDAHAHRTIDA